MLAKVRFTRLRAICALTALLFAATVEVDAGDVRLQFEGFNGTGVSVNGSTNTTAGQFHWTAIGPENALPSVFPPNVNKAVKTFCIEIGEFISQGSNYLYQIRSDLHNLPQDSYGAGMGLVKAQNLQNLGDLLGKGLLNPIGASLADVQAAVWNLVFDTDFVINSGTFNLTGINQTKVNSILTAVANYNQTSRSYYFLGLSNTTANGGAGAQDHIILVNQQGFQDGGGSIVPVPAGVVLSSIGIFCISGVSFIRRRKLVAAA